MLAGNGTDTATAIVDNATDTTVAIHPGADAVNFATDGDSHVGPAVSEALAAANQAALLRDEGLQHSTVQAALSVIPGSAALSAVHEPVGLNDQAQQPRTAYVATSSTMPGLSQSMDWSQEAQLQQVPEAIQQPSAEQGYQTGFGYLLTAPNLPAGVTYQQAGVFAHNAA